MSDRLFAAFVEAFGADEAITIRKMAAEARADYVGSEAHEKKRRRTCASVSTSSVAAQGDIVMTATTKTEIPLWMTLAIAAKIAGESRQTLWRRSKDGTLETVQRGRTIMVSRDALLRYMGLDPIEQTKDPASQQGPSLVLSDQGGGSR